MNKNGNAITILLADDDPDDRMLAKEAFVESRLRNQLEMVEDGEELMDYLNQQGKYSGANKKPKPDLILLDLNMPRKDGREALREIKSSPELRRIPIVVLTTSRADMDIEGIYELGANSFISKPVQFEGLVSLMRVLGQYWFDTVALPATRG